MKCPRCVQRIHRTATSCPQCGFSVEEADLVFGADPGVMRRLTDAAGLLRLPDRKRVNQALDHFGWRFPQLFLAVYTSYNRSFTERISLRQFGFWLLNRAVFRDCGTEQTNASAVLLVIDADSRSACLSYGYFLDPFLDEDDAFGCLAKAHPHFLERDYLRGILAVAGALEKTLRRRSRQARRNQERFARRVGPPQETGSLVRRNREAKRGPRHMDEGGRE